MALVRFKLFGTSGVRGAVGEKLTPELALKVGLAAASYLGPGDAVVGRDVRLSSPAIEAAFSAGLMAGGCKVLRLGLAPTPACAFLTKKLGAKLGASITASHNPPEYNGIKIFDSGGVAISDEQQAEMEELVLKNGVRPTSWDKMGASEDASYALALYEEEALSRVGVARKWRVLIDAGGGATAYIAPRLFSKLGCEVISLNCRPDGLFKARSPEPSPESLKSTCEIVRELGVDVGFAYDGDGDRVVVIDEKGEVQPLDASLAAFAAYAIRKAGGGEVITHVEASRCIEDAVEAVGGRVVRVKVGDVNIARAIVARGAVFGGEPCGAWIHPNFHLCPDGVFSSLAFLQMLDEEGIKPSDAIKGVPRYRLTRAKVKISAPPDAIMAAVRGILERRLSGFREVEEVDGVKLIFDNGWVLVRPSGTEPVIRITAESSDGIFAERLAKEAEAAVREAERSLS